MLLITQKQEAIKVLDKGVYSLYVSNMFDKFKLLLDFNKLDKEIYSTKGLKGPDLQSEEK